MGFIRRRHLHFSYRFEYRQIIKIADLVYRKYSVKLFQIIIRRGPWAAKKITKYYFFDFQTHIPSPIYFFVITYAFNYLTNLLKLLINLLQINYLKDPSGSFL